MKKTCFVIGPIGEENSQERAHANGVRDKIIKPIVEEELGYEIIRADEYEVAGQITYQIVKLIVESDLVIADLSFHNPNVFYELALRHVTRKNFIHLIREEDTIPFDIKEIRAIRFDLSNNDKVEEAKIKLRKQLKSFEKGELKTIQHISILLGRLGIIFHAFKQVNEKGLTEDRYGSKFGSLIYKNKVIGILGVCKTVGDELVLKNIDANIIDASRAKLGTFYIKNCMINHLDIDGSQINKLIMEATITNIMDASKSKINIFVKKKAIFINSPDVTGASILSELEK